MIFFMILFQLIIRNIMWYSKFDIQTSSYFKKMRYVHIKYVRILELYVRNLWMVLQKTTMAILPKSRDWQRMVTWHEGKYCQSPAEHEIWSSLRSTKYSSRWRSFPKTSFRYLTVLYCYTAFWNFMFIRLHSRKLID